MFLKTINFVMTFIGMKKVNHVVVMNMRHDLGWG